MARQYYHNGDPITLNGCNGCNPSRINGVLCHEAGCPDAWRDHTRECKECGTTFYPADPAEFFCSPHCYRIYNGGECDCDFCRELSQAEDSYAQDE